MIKQLIKRFPKVKDLVDDCQSRLDFSDGYFDRILAIHILEHLPNLPEAVMKMHRLLNKKSGVFSVVMPCEGGIFYYLAGRISAQWYYYSTKNV
jgi:predicted SAM-dependent methyltransferase